ncbi:MAG: TetR/AcrR family transcriptional regulator [Frankiaceae bacterium]|nr:TetR/AcrR family transcriptional regulator [Frankiaceae bacterium]MBV9872557.1 TetR/AcrR family transcriptional regulator [Frankiaceae bacterium]
MIDDAGEPGTTDTDPVAESLRERKKRLTRQLLSDTATQMFLERGFDGFKITEVAEECGVSEKTVYNYFPTKESLILDREEDMAIAIREALSDRDKPPVDAIADVLLDERQRMRDSMADFGGDQAGLAMFRRFMAAVEATPSLVAELGKSFDRLARLAAECLAERAGVSPDDPEPTIAGRALMGLWTVQRQALLRDDPADTSASDVYARAEDEVRRAARLINTGLWSFAASGPGSGSSSREQFRAAADATQTAGRQVAAALKQARKAFEEARAFAAEHAGDGDAWSTASWDWNQFMPNEPDLSTREARQQWRESQREYVQRWREAQREQAQQWKQAAQAFKEEQREATRKLRDEMKAAHRSHQDDLRRGR